jgi:hypothetical protein
MKSLGMATQCYPAYKKRPVCIVSAKNSVVKGAACQVGRWYDTISLSNVGPMTVVGLLDHARSLGILEDVSDEGGFRDQRDVQALAREVGNWNNMIAGFAGQMKDWFGDQFVAEIPNFPDLEHLEAKCRAED